MNTEKNTITGEVRTRLPYVKLGQIMLEKCGESAWAYAWAQREKRQFAELSANSLGLDLCKILLEIRDNQTK